MNRLATLRLALAGLALTALVPTAHAQTATDTALAVRDASATPLLHLRPDAGFAVFGTAGTGTIPATGEGARLMWYPGKYAFRAGRVGDFDYTNGASNWDEANIGAGSVAMGINTRASGAAAVALGTASTASGDRAFAFNGYSGGIGSVAIGSGAQATGDESIALGQSSIAGGLGATVIGPSIANGNYAYAIGVQNSAAGNFSVAIGKNARALDACPNGPTLPNPLTGVVVISDGSAIFSSDCTHARRNNEFVVRGAGGLTMYTSTNLSSGVEVAPGGSSWSSVSDRNRKHGFTDVDGEDLLERLGRVPVTTWHYNAQGDAVRHMGAMAQDFYSAFGLGEDSLRIGTVDMDGVTLRGVQALASRTDALSGTAEALSAELEATRAVVSRQADELRALRAELAARDAALAERLARLEAAQATKPPVPSSHLPR